MKAGISFACALALLGGPVLQMRAAEDVDLLLINGNIYTVSEKQAHAEAIAVQKDQIVFVGSNEEAKNFMPPRLSILPAKRPCPA